jgi:hypothetical protein
MCQVVRLYKGTLVAIVRHQMCQVVRLYKGTTVAVARHQWLKNLIS